VKGKRLKENLKVYARVLAQKLVRCSVALSELSVVVHMLHGLNYLIDQFHCHARDDSFSICEGPLQRAESHPCLLAGYPWEELQRGVSHVGVSCYINEKHIPRRSRGE
jgi:hypothetical protein